MRGMKLIHLQTMMAQAADTDHWPPAIHQKRGQEQFLFKRSRVTQVTHCTLKISHRLGALDPYIPATAWKSYCRPVDKPASRFIGHQVLNNPMRLNLSLSLITLQPPRM